MTTEAKLADHWADRAVAALAGVSDMARWIVSNRWHLHKCDQASPNAYARVRAAIAKRWDEIDQGVADAS